MKRIILLGSILLNCLMAVALVFVLFHYGVFSTILNKINSPSAKENSFVATPYYLTNNDVFNSKVSEMGGVVLLGDSITNFNEWEEALPSKNIKNRGIDGDTTLGVLNRLDNIIKLKPEKIFILIGINDLSTNIKSEQIIKNYKEIVSTLKEDLPNTDIYVQSVLPINEKLAKKFYKSNVKNENIIHLNEVLKKMAETQNVAYIDLYSNFVNSSDEMSENYTIDGIHLNGKGYVVWEGLLKPYLD